MDQYNCAHIKLWCTAGRQCKYTKNGLQQAKTRRVRPLYDHQLIHFVAITKRLPVDLVTNSVYCVSFIKGVGGNYLAQIIHHWDTFFSHKTRFCPKLYYKPLPLNTNRTLNTLYCVYLEIRKKPIVHLLALLKRTDHHG